MISKIKYDIPASIVVFLVALPLCLGVALASGAPLLSGIIAGIIGGVVVGILSESHASVSGPAAGLTAVVLAAITKLGTFELFLSAVVLAGMIQLFAGIMKAGFIANFIPSNVIKGLLAAIGIILILKQIPHAVGFDKDNVSDLSFNQPDGENTFSELLNIFDYFSWGAIIISSISVITMLVWDYTPLKKISFFPSSLMVVLLGVGLNTMFMAIVPSLAISSEHLVNIPSFEGFGSMITLPDFTQIANAQVWTVAFTIAVVASIETLLNLEAVENLDPQKRQASPNRELVAQGAGNILAGMLGGIPITSVIVRSSVNLNAGAQTKLSSILHGVFLLASVVFLSSILNLIPLASLASILLLTGYKLAKVSLFKDMYKNGLNQFIPFVSTILAIVFTDLLIGVLIGLAISIFYILKSNFKNAYHFEKTTTHTGDEIKIRLSEEVSFLNKASIKETLFVDIPDGSKVVIDGSHSKYIDYDVLEVIHDFSNSYAKEKNIQLTLIGFKSQYLPKLS
ncbi:MAG: SulP family inorganic anion transporter [Bacteroidia bacterium]|nr:SulP family inorganic anion transporter [Bacteroidia bacterium]